MQKFKKKKIQSGCLQRPKSNQMAYKDHSNNNHKMSILYKGFNYLERELEYDSLKKMQNNIF